LEEEEALGDDVEAGISAKADVAPPSIQAFASATNEASGSTLRTPTVSIIRHPGAAVSPSTSDIAEASFDEEQHPHQRDGSTATLRPPPHMDDGLPVGSAAGTGTMFRTSYGRRRGQLVDEGSIRASLGPINSGRKSLRMGSVSGRDGNYRPLSRIFLTGDAAGSALYKS